MDYALDFDPGVAEIDQYADLEAGGFQVIQALGGMDNIQGFD
jgi:hypothetical protein